MPACPPAYPDAEKGTGHEEASCFGSGPLTGVRHSPGCRRAAFHPNFGAEPQPKQRGRLPPVRESRRAVGRRCPHEGDRGIRDPCLARTLRPGPQLLSRSAGLQSRLLGGADPAGTRFKRPSDDREIRRCLVCAGALLAELGMLSVEEHWLEPVGGLLYSAAGPLIEPVQPRPVELYSHHPLLFDRGLGWRHHP